MRILFEYFINILGQQKEYSQQLLFFKEIYLSKAELEIVLSMEENLNQIGFIFEVKENTIIITSIPSECQDKNLQIIIENLIEQFKNSEKVEIKQKESLAKSLAKSLAVSEHKKLEDKEIKSLSKELFKCKSPSVCPNGNRTMINLKIADLEKYF
jgi:DNA mismatch repair protein MutL